MVLIWNFFWDMSRHERTIRYQGYKQQLSLFKNMIKFNRFSLRVRSSQRSHASHIIQELRCPRLFLGTVVISLPMT